MVGSGEAASTRASEGGSLTAPTWYSPWPKIMGNFKIKYGLRWGIVTCDFGLLGFQAEILYKVIMPRSPRRIPRDCNHWLRPQDHTTSFNDTRGLNDHLNMRISHSGSKAQ